jgi:putative proteasome-type protease
MTYCLAIRCDQGLVFASDSRTNAGVDHVGTYSKMFIFEYPDDRLVTLLSAGNLATTQQVVATLKRQAEDPQAVESLRTFKSIDEVAGYVGRVSRHIQSTDGAAAGGLVDTTSTFIVGGQIGLGRADIFLVYPEGNFISCSEQMPFLQIGEIKYGKPILDRNIHRAISLEDAARAALVSIDSTMRSNISVGPPVELLLYRAGDLQVFRHQTFDLDTPFYAAVKEEWQNALRRALDNLPRFDWE